MTNPTDTNQASEDEQRTLDDILSQAFTDGASDTMWIADRHVEIFATAKEELQALIRNEKLRLLAAVRERVVGTKDLKLSDIYGNDWRNNYGYTEVQVRDAANHLQRKQLNSLTKLEAEL